MKGILFQEPLFIATIEGRKTQTRRTGGFNELIKQYPDDYKFIEMENDPRVLKFDKEGFPVEDKHANFKTKKLKGWYGCFEVLTGSDYDGTYFIPRYQPGETIYLKEPYRLDAQFGLPWYKYNLHGEDNTAYKWKNKLFMPAKHARYFIKITDVRAERLHEITEADAIAEGIESWTEERMVSKPTHYKVYYNEPGDDSSYSSCPVVSYETLWQKINGKDSWIANPLVWVYTYELTDRPKILTPKSPPRRVLK